MVAHSDHLRRAPRAVELLDQPLVLARDRQGQAFALVDRCPHRQVPLSAGRMIDEGLQCPYHGWIFGSDGRCKKLPGLLSGETPPAVSATRVPCVEAGGWIWVKLREQGAAVPPDAMTSAMRDAVALTWDDRWNAPAIDIIENFLDPLHTHTIHPGIVRRDKQRSTINAALRADADGFTVDYRGQPSQSGLIYRLFESERSKERVVFRGPASARIEYGYSNGSEVHITLHFTPESAGRTRLWGRLEVRGRRVPRALLRWLLRPMLLKVARQDQTIVEMQYANRLKFPPARGVSTRLDIVRPYLDAFWSGQDTPPASEDDVVMFI
ncbi:Rieske 2Fe-2S domain-containing protein [Herbaspirillum sp. NPDC087042]|uniref:Rieske 2Fe-2S domain-containing protein n=1 Tax=Herbaspirillum sp. NPDC087042 TaxID=3364004 RepID=UPI00381DF9E1